MGIMDRYKAVYSDTNFQRHLNAIQNCTKDEGIKGKVKWAKNKKKRRRK